MDFNTESFIEEIDNQYSKLNVDDMEKYLINTIYHAGEKYGEESAGYAALLNELGGFYRTVSKYEKAEEIFLKAKVVIERVAGKDNSNYATTINNLAGVYRLTGDYKKAEQLFFNAIEIYKNISFEGSFVYSSALNNLGLLYMDMKEYQKAANLFEEAKEIAKKESNDPVIYATGLANLANAYISIKKTKEAEELLIEAIEVYKEHNQKGSSHYGAAINSLGMLYFSIRYYAKAEKLFLEVLELREKAYGQNNHEVAKVLDNLSVLYENIGKYEIAEKCAKQSLVIYLNLLGEDHPFYKKSTETLERIQNKLDKQKANKSQIEKTDSNMIKGISGMELAFISFAQFSAAAICRRFTEYSDRIAAGLIGEGSECYGFDDEYSMDHDFGPAFCIWLTTDDYNKIGNDLQNEYKKITKNLFGMEMEFENKQSEERRGVFDIGCFYKKYIGLDRPPVTLKEWRSIPEINLSIVTNGRVFIDKLGEFSKFRNELKAFYPEDVRLKKVAARCAIMAQAGQYNYPRSIRRLEYVAANQALAEFIDAAISAVFLLNKEYKPYYKWMHRALKALPILGIEMYNKFFELTKENNFDKKILLIEEICNMVEKEIVKQGMSESSSRFLLDHANEIQRNIKDNELRLMHVMAE